MEDDDGALLSVGFAIDFHDSHAQLRALDAQMGSTQANGVREFQKLEAASKSALNLAGAIGEVKAFGNAVGREGANAAREWNRVEKAGEAMVRRMEGQIATYGKTREQIRLGRVEELAAAADTQKMTELSGRLRASEAQLAELELKKRLDAERAVNMELAERARIQAAIGQNTGAGRIPATSAGATFSALAERAEEEERALQKSAMAAQEAAKQQAAYAAQAGALRAQLDPMFAAQQRFNQALDQADDLYRAGAITSNEYAAAQRFAREALQQHAKAVAGTGAAMDDLSRPMGMASGNARQFSLQMSQVGQQVMAGTSVIQALAMQLPDVAAGMNASAGGTSKFAAVLGGPWGIAATAAIGLAASYAYKLWDTDDAAKKAAKSNLSLSDALTKFKSATDEARKAIDEYNKAQQQGRDDAEYMISVNLRRAESNLKVAETEKEKFKALLATREAEFMNRPIFANPNEQGGVQMAQGIELRRIQQQMKDAEKDAERLAQLRRNLMGTQAQRDAEAAVDPLRKINNTYDDMSDRAKAAAASNDKLTASLNATLKGIETRRKAALDAQKEEDRAASAANRGRDMAQFGSPIANPHITSGYGRRARPTAGASTDHLAIDFAAKVGQAIYAAADGIVKVAANRGGFGNRIELAHGASTKSTYSHLSGFNVRDGQAVNKGDVIGFAGKTGVATGPHLHYEVWVNGHKVDPRKGLFPVDAAQVAEQSAKAQDALQQFGDRSAESVARLTEQFDEQPRLMDQAARSVRQLDDTIADLQKRQPPGFEKTIAEAQAAKGVIEQSLLRPFKELEEAAQRRGQIATLNAEGFGTEASVLQTIWQIEERLGKLTPERAAAVRKIVEDEAKQLANAQATAAIRSADEDVTRLGVELDLIGKSNEARAIALAQYEAEAVIRANPGMSPEKQKELAETYKDRAKNQEFVNQATLAYNESLSRTANLWDIISGKISSAGQGMASAFGEGGRAIGDLASIYADYNASRSRAEEEHRKAILDAGDNQQRIAMENERFALRSSGAQVEAFGDMAAAAKGFFKEGSSGYKALAAAEKVYRLAQFAMSLQSMVQNTLETTTTVANAGVKATAEGTAGIAAQSKLPFPFNIAAMAATGAALVAAGVMVFGGTNAGSNTLPKSNEGRGTVFGDTEAQSESIRRGIDALADIDTVMLGHSRDMAASLKSIESQIGGFASLVLRTGNVNASNGVVEGFNPNGIGSALGGVPVIGGLLKGLFGTKTKVVGSGLFGDAQTLDEILGGGFDASYYSDVQKKKKLFGITTSTKYSTKFGEADLGLENQFTLILREFNSAILSAAGPLGESTGAIEQKLRGFVVDIGKIDLQGLTGEEIEEKLSAVFGSAADKMATAAFPGMERFQKVGEGLFETLVRVSSTVESVTASLDLLGSSSAALGIDAKVGLAGRFENVGAFSSGIEGYFDKFYSEQEKAAARTAQMTRVFEGMGLTMPGTIAAFRSLVEAQDLASASGQSTYATLLQLAPAFADLRAEMVGAEQATRSVADVLAERRDIERKILELQGNTSALRDLDIAKIDESNRALQQRYWALSDEKEAIAAATQAANDRASAAKAEGDAVIGIQIRMSRALGDDKTAKALERMQELNGAPSAEVRAQLERWHTVEDAIAQQNKLTAAYEQQAAAVQRVTEDAYASAKALREYADEIYGKGTIGDIDAMRDTIFAAMGAGDVKALPGLIDAYLPEALKASGSKFDYLLETAGLAQGARDTADYADARAAYAGAQTAAMLRDDMGWQYGNQAKDLRGSINDMRDQLNETLGQLSGDNREIGKTQIRALNGLKTKLDDLSGGTNVLNMREDA